MEFFGVVMFTVFKMLVDQLIMSKFSYEDRLNEEFQSLDVWIAKIENCNGQKSLEPEIYLAIRNNLEDSFLYNYNIVSKYNDFYSNLSP